MQFTPNILLQAGRDFCNAMLSYFHQKNLIIFTNPSDKKEENTPQKTPNYSNLKIFSFDHENLLEEIEAVKEVIKEENGEEGDEDKDKGDKSNLNNSDQEGDEGSDSEPSLDNFENDELVKLLPSLPKKKSKEFILKVKSLNI